MHARSLCRQLVRGLTLVELLMVVTILVILMAISVPLARSANEDRKLREASRMLNAYLAGAQARAFERGRPVWVVIDRENTTMGLRLGLAETPPPYSGDVLDARCFFNSSTNTVTFATGHADLVPTLVKGGDLIRFNYQGLYYPISATPTSASFTITAPVGQTGAPSPPVAASGMAFQIFRKPVPSTATPLQMPKGVCIDLQVSGFGPGASNTNGEFRPASASDITPVMFSFSPGGRLDSLEYGGTTYSASSPLHVLLGYVDKIGAGNLADPKAIWVSVNHTTGVINTTDNFASSTILAARSWASAAENLGGR